MKHDYIFIRLICMRVEYNTGGLRVLKALLRQKQNLTWKKFSFVIS
jgi:hypothetical protein